MQLNLGRSYATNQPVIDEIWAATPQTVALVGRGHDSLDGVRDPHGDLGGLAAGHEPRPAADVGVDGHLVDSRLLARDDPPHVLRGAARPLPDGRDREPGGQLHRAGATARPALAHDAALPDARDRVRRRVRSRHALVDSRRHARGLPHARARERTTRLTGSRSARGAQRVCCRPRPSSRSTSGSSSPGRSRSRRCSRGPGWGCSPTSRCAGPTCRCCRASSSCSARP